MARTVVWLQSSTGGGQKTLFFLLCAEVVCSCSSRLANWFKKNVNINAVEWPASCNINVSYRLFAEPDPRSALINAWFFRTEWITAAHCFLNILYSYSVTPGWLKRFLTEKLLPPTLSTSYPNQFGTIWNWPFFSHFQLKMTLSLGC